MNYPDYLAIGDISVDIAARVPHIPGVDEKLQVEAIGEFQGGMGANAAAAVAALGGSAGLATSVGRDARGQAAIDDLNRRGVDTRLIHQIDDPTFWTLALLTPGGEKTLIEFPSAAISVDWNQFDWTVLKHVRFVHVIPGDIDQNERVLAEAHQHGSRSSLDLEATMFSLDDLPRRLANLDVLFMNRGCSEKIGSDLSTAARRVRDMGPKVVVTTLGADGCFVLDRHDNETHVPGHVVHVLDTTGAGDCFAGSFAYGLLCGWDDVQCAELANLSAAISTTAIGSREAVMDCQRLRTLAREKGYSWWEGIR